MLSLSEALQELTQRLMPIEQTQRLPLLSCLGRYCAEHVDAQTAIPAFANSAMDGYAFKHSPSLFQFDPPYLLKQVGVSYAGHPYTGKVDAGECVRIFTGAPLPDDCDTVALQENVSTVGALISLHQRPKLQEWVRPVGHDAPQGKRLIKRGVRLAPQHLGLAAAAGRVDLEVFAKPTIAVMSNGDELRPLGSSLGPGQIYDSNRLTLLAQLAQFPVEALDLGCVPDDPHAITTTLSSAATRAHLILTCGGVSVGDADHVKGVLERIGTLEFWKVAIKPGKPLAFGRIDKAAFLGLPGNPVSSFLTFNMIAKPAIERICGAQVSPPIPTRARLVEPIRRDPGRLEYMRAILQQDGEGAIVKTTGNQSSGILSSVTEANCFLVIEASIQELKEGDWVEVLPFAQ